MQAWELIGRVQVGGSGSELLVLQDIKCSSTELRGLLPWVDQLKILGRGAQVQDAVKECRTSGLDPGSVMQ